MLLCVQTYRPIMVSPGTPPSLTFVSQSPPFSGSGPADASLLIDEMLEGPAMVILDNATVAIFDLGEVASFSKIQVYANVPGILGSTGDAIFEGSETSDFAVTIPLGTATMPPGSTWTDIDDSTPSAPVRYIRLTAVGTWGASEIRVLS